MMIKEMTRPLFSKAYRLYFPKYIALKQISLAQVLLLGALILSVPSQSQDIHYTQFQNAPFITSPGLTGVFREDVRLIANYRRQWFSIPQVNFETFSVAVDIKLRPNRLIRNDYFAVGLSINRDQAGTAKLTLLNLGLNGSYTHRLSNSALLSFGMQGAFNQRRFDISDLSFDKQYIFGGGGYDPTLPSGESKYNGTNAFLSLSAGFNLRFQKLNKRVLFNDQKQHTKVDIGFGFNNLNRPNQSFEEDNPIRLPRRISAYILSTLQLGNSNFDLVVNALTQVQDDYFELVSLLGIKYHLSQQVDAKKAIQLSSAVRFGDQPGNYLDAIAPVLEFFVNSWQIGVSYDINLSPFKVATNGDSGIEFSLRRSFSRVKLLNPRPFITL